MRAYCDFYEVDPSDDALLALSRALIADPDREGVQFLARDDERRAGRLRDGVLELGHDRGEQDRNDERPLCRPAARAAAGWLSGSIQECLSRCESAARRDLNG